MSSAIVSRCVKRWPAVGSREAANDKPADGGKIHNSYNNRLAASPGRDNIHSNRSIPDIGKTLGMAAAGQNKHLVAEVAAGN